MGVETGLSFSCYHTCVLCHVRYLSGLAIMNINNLNHLLCMSQLRIYTLFIKGVKISALLVVL